MFTSDALFVFGTKTKIAKAVNVTQAAVSQWGVIVPEKHASRLEKLSDGQLEYKLSAYPIKAA